MRNNFAGVFEDVLQKKSTKKKEKEIVIAIQPIPHREGNKLSGTLKDFQVPINSNIHAIPISK